MFTWVQNKMNNGKDFTLTTANTDIINMLLVVTVILGELGPEDRG